MAIQYVDVVNGSDTFQTVSISGATRANPCVITSNSHGFGDGQWIRITGVVGMTQLNNNTYKTANVDANTFELQYLNGDGVNSSAFGTYTSGGTVTQWKKTPIYGITKAFPAVVTAKKHGFSNGNLIIIEDVNGMTEVNNVCFEVNNATTDTFELKGIDSSLYGTWESGGTVTRPFYTMNALEAVRGNVSSPQNSFWVNGDSVLFAKTFSYGASITVGSGNITFTRNSATISTSSDLSGVFAVGDYIGLTSASLNGWDSVSSPDRPDMFYRVVARNSTSITTDSKYSGTTTTVSSVYKLRLGTEIRSTGAASSHAISTTAQGNVYEGGWSFNSTGPLTRDGTTAIKGLTDSGDFYSWNTADLSSVFRYFSFFGYARGLVTYAASSNLLIEYCSCYSRTYSGFWIQGSYTTIQKCHSNPSVSTNYACFYIAGTGNYCYMNYGNSSSTQGNASCFVASGSSAVKNCISEIGVYGVSASYPAIVENCKSIMMTYGFSLDNNAKIYNCESAECSRGIINAPSGHNGIADSCTISNSSTAGFEVGNCFNTYIENCSFINNYVDVSTTTYSSGIKLTNCSSQTPSTYFVTRNLWNPPILIQNCSIDSPSLSKAFQTVAGANYNTPQYLIQNSFGITGQYYANGYLLEDSSDYRTSSPSLKLAWNTTVSKPFVPIKIFSTYVTGGVEKTISFYIKGGPSWSGSITPILKLNGTTIKTGSDIASLTADWLSSFSISASVSEINEDGELSLEFYYGANNSPIWIDDISVL